MTKNDTKTITLYDLIMHKDETIYRNALSILKRLREVNPICRVCRKTWPAGTREATRDFVFHDICIKCNMP